LKKKEFLHFIVFETGYKIYKRHGVKWVGGIGLSIAKNTLLANKISVGEALFEKYGKQQSETLKRLLDTPYDFRRYNQTDDFSSVLINTGNLEADIEKCVLQIQHLRKTKKTL
jgi:hypothetical protein